MKYIVSLILVKIISLGKKIAKVITIFIYKLEVRLPHGIEESEASITKTNDIKQQTKKERVCHFHELFITQEGKVIPCCMTGGKPHMIIGHINDENLLDSIKSFYGDCSCERFKLKKGSPEDKMDYSFFNIELAFTCQAKCAMCLVDAPSWKGKYDYYESCTKIINLLKPTKIGLQGGEILVQKKSLKWIAEIKNNHPDIEILLVTNGNVNLNMIETVENLFDELNISIVGFQAETYKIIMGINLEKTVKFAEELAKRKKIKLVLKYLTTPLNIHETNLFLEWAITLDPILIRFDDVYAGTMEYINVCAPHEFWSKIFKRSGQEIRSLLIANKDKLREKNMKIQFRTNCLDLLGLNEDFDDFLKENGLSEKVGRLSA